MRKSIISFVAALLLAVTVMFVGAPSPASAVNWCGDQQSYILRPHKSGNAWIAETGCGVTNQSHTNLGVGGDLTNLQLCSIVMGTCVNIRCIDWSGSWCAATGIPSGNLLKARVQRDGVVWYSPYIYA